jgi:gp16 family phage-associated protein
MANLITLEEVRSALRAAGKTQAELARELSAELGVAEALVHQILSGRLSGTRGAARRIKVRLGLASDDMSALEVVTAAANKGAA